VAKNNLLLGNGQALVGPTEWPTVGRPKPDVYSLAESRERLHPQLELFDSQARNVPAAAAPRGEVVGKILVHPEYLAKSHFPAKVLRSVGLRVVGTRSRSVQPRRRNRKTNPDDPMLTAELLVAGTHQQFHRLDAELMGGHSTAMLRDLSRIEEIGFMAPEDRIRSLRPVAGVGAWVYLEAVLHADELDDDIVAAFAMWAQECGGRADVGRAMAIDSLTFLPVHVPQISVNDLARFSHLRVIRSVVPLRHHESSLRGTRPLVPLRIPADPPVAPDIRVAVFDGGLAAPAIAAHATERMWPETTVTSDDFLEHGALVTSAVLYGPVDSTAKVLPRPYAHVDHYRIATPHDETDPEMFDAVRRICEVLDEGRHQFANISLAPSIPVEDDDVHLWTSALEKRLASGRVLLTVAAGNDGDLAYPGSRVQVPSDLVNAVAVGASSAPGGLVSRWAKSSIGPGRSPGLIKPDGIAWGSAVPLYDPRSGHIVAMEGTSVAAPLALRTAVGAAALANGVSSVMSRALLVHTAERSKGSSQAEIGHGRFCHDPLDLITCGNREAMVVYEGRLEPGRPVGARLPWPDGAVFGRLRIRATLVFHTPVDLAHPLNYTKAGIEARLRRSPGGKTVSFFSRSKVFENTEQQMRADAHKWETVVSKEIGVNADTLSDPVLELVYRARDEGLPVNNATLEPLPYVLVVTVVANAEPEFYDRVRQRYPVLIPMQLRVGVQLPT